MNDREYYPVQIDSDFGQHARNPTMGATVVERAYEVYCHVYGPQPAMMTNECRGGFSIGELIAFLYARSFPKDEWKKRLNEALRRKP